MRFLRFKGPLNVGDEREGYEVGVFADYSRWLVNHDTGERHRLSDFPDN